MMRGRLWQKKERRFHEQHGLCYYCKEPMLLQKMPAKAKLIPRDLCTLEHLDDRYSPDRGKHEGKIRVVAACRKCNSEQNRIRQETLDKALLWQKSGSPPNDFFDSPPPQPRTGENDG